MQPRRLAPRVGLETNDQLITVAAGFARGLSAVLKTRGTQVVRSDLLPAAIPNTSE